jgi:hypothetical protein
MLATCDHCGHRNEVPDSAENTEVLCQKCNQPFFALSPAEIAADRRATKLLLTTVLLVLALIFVLLMSRSDSRAINSARRALVGKSIAGQLGNGSGDGVQETSGNGNPGATGPNQTLPFNGPPDPLATNSERSPDASIGRLAESVGERKPGDEVRAGAAGNDDPAERVGNSRAGQITNAPSAGGNPGNSGRRNSVETPEGADLLTGNSAGADATALSSTNSRPTTLLLDDFSERLRQAGARSGDVQISLEWKNANDLDLHVIDPSGERIFFNHRNSASGGELDVDMNAGQLSTRPVENVYWPERGAPRGTYRVEVVHFANHGARDPTEFNVRVVNKGQSSYYRGYISYLNARGGARNHIAVCTFAVR